MPRRKRKDAERDWHGVPCRIRTKEDAKRLLAEGRITKAYYERIMARPDDKKCGVLN